MQAQIQIPEYLARQLAARIHELMKANDCQWLMLDCSISRLVKVQIFTHPLVLEKLSQYGIKHVPKGHTDDYEVNYEKQGMRFKSRVTVCSGRIVNALCPISRKHYEAVHNDYHKEENNVDSN